MATQKRGYVLRSMARSCLSFGDLSFTLPYHSPCAPGNGQQRLLASGWYSRQLISRPRPALTNPASAPAPSATATRPMHVAHQPAGTPQMQGTIDRRIAYATATVIAPIWPVCPTNHHSAGPSIARLLPATTAPRHPPPPNNMHAALFTGPVLSPRQ